MAKRRTRRKAHDITDNVLGDVEKEIEFIYTDAIKELEKELNDMISWEEILEIEDPRKRLIAMNKNRRLTKLISKLSEIIKNKNMVSWGIINDNLVDIFILNHDYSAYDIEHELGMHLDFTLYNRDAVSELLKSTTPVFTKMAYNGSKDLKMIVNDLRRNLTQSILKGESINEIAKRVRNITGKNMHDSIRVARTETTRIQNSGNMKAYEHGVKMGVELEKTWISTLDGRTRHKRHGENHRTMMGETVPVDKKFSNGLMYPADPTGSAGNVINCRCTTISEIKGMKKGIKEKELDQKLKEKTFEQWQENRKPKVKKKEDTKRDNYTRKDLNNMSNSQLRERAKKLAMEYYPKSGISFGDVSIESAVNSLMSQNRSKTSLIKDIISMQNKLK